MKKNLLFLLATAAVATGCSKDSVLESDVNTARTAISFDTYKSITKGASIGSNDVLCSDDNSFGVTAFIERESSKYMNNVEIAYSNGSWEYVNSSEMVFWPLDKSVNFFALFPFENNFVDEYVISVDLHINKSRPASPGLAYFGITASGCSFLNFIFIYLTHFLIVLP